MASRILSVSKSWPLIFVHIDDPEEAMDKLSKIEPKEESNSSSNVSAIYLSEKQHSFTSNIFNQIQLWKSTKVKLVDK